MCFTLNYYYFFFLFRLSFEYIRNLSHEKFSFFHLLIFQTFSYSSFKNISIELEKLHVKNMEINYVYFTFSFSFDIPSWQFSEFRLLMKGRWPFLILIGYAHVFKEDVSLHLYFDTSVILSDKSLKNDLKFFFFLSCYSLCFCFL